MSSFSFSSGVVGGAPRNTPARQDLIAALGAGAGGSLSAGPVSKAVSSVAAGAPAKQSASPLNVRAGSGKVRYDVGDLRARGFGNLWGHSRTYLNAEGPGKGGTNGNRWVVDQWWYLHFVDAPPGDNAPARIKLQRGGPGSLWFKPGDLPGDYVPATTFTGSLRHDAGAMTFTHTDAKGRRRVFHDNSIAHPAALRGQLRAVHDAYGNGATLHYDSNDELALVSWTGTGSQEALSFRYSYDDALAHIGRLRQVVQQVGGRDVARVRYTYWTTGEGGGSANDLKGSQVEEFDATTSTWKTIRREHYRYWLPGQADGIRSGLKYLVGPETYERLVNGGIDPETATEAQIAAAADHHLAYQGDRRVVRQSLRGGQDLYQYNYVGNADAPSFDDKNTWAACSEMVLPDGNRKRYYTNRSGGLVLEAREDVALGRTSYQAVQRNADGRMVQKATPAAIGSVVEPGSGSGSLQVNLRPDSGLIYEYGYASATNPGTGEIKGLPTTRSIRQGASGTAEKVSTLVWTTQTANGVSIHKPSAKILYTGVLAAAARSRSGDAKALDEEEQQGEVSEYQYDYLYYKDAEDNNTFQVLQKTTTLPVIPLGQNGDGQTYTIVERFDEYGNRIWLKNARGYITRWEYVIETGALKRRIEDVDTSRLENVPEGWTTPSDGGRHLTYDYESDLQGRTVRELGPPHEAVLKECDRKATVPRSARFTLHQDALHETWRVAGYATGDAPSYGYETVGAVIIERRDAAGRLLDTIQARRSCCCGPLQAGEQFPQRQWTRWTKYFYDAWGRVTKTRIYHRIPRSGEGFRGEHYSESRTGYDDLGRVIRQQAPGGTITRLVYDSEGRLASIWWGPTTVRPLPAIPPAAGPRATTWWCASPTSTTTASPEATAC